MVQINVDEITKKYSMEQFLEIMRLLRAPDGCPWDKLQTHESIRNNFLEEVYEAVDAIDNCDSAALREELGDVLMQVVFHSIMAEEEKVFDFSDVVDEVCKKLVYRHPHVFSNTVADTPEKVLDNWEALKRAEKEQTTYTDTLKSVPKAFPALMFSSKVQKRASKAGVTPVSKESVISKIKQLTHLLEKGEGDNAENIGDLLFAVVSLSRILDTDSEEALSRSTDKFINRFSEKELSLINNGGDIKELSDKEKAFLLNGN